MIDLQNYFDMLFISPKITHLRLDSFSEDHINKMIANNPGSIYDGSITATTNARNDFAVSIGLKAADKGTAKGDTSAKGVARVALEVYIGNNIGMARGAFGGKTTPKFIETFPNLMNSFYKVDDATFSTNVATLITKATKYVADLGVPFKTALANLYATYSGASSEQGTGVTAVNTDIINENAYAVILSDQLTANVLLIGRNNRGSLTAKFLYFDVPKLYPVQHKEIKKGQPAGGSETDIPIVYSAGKRTHMHNKGATSLILGMKLLGVKVGTAITMLPDGKINQAFDFYYSNGDALYIINPEAGTGIFQLDIIS